MWATGAGTEICPFSSSARLIILFFGFSLTWIGLSELHALELSPPVLRMRRPRLAVRVAGAQNGMERAKIEACERECIILFL